MIGPHRRQVGPLHPDGRLLARQVRPQPLAVPLGQVPDRAGWDAAPPDPRKGRHRFGIGVLGGQPDHLLSQGRAIATARQPPAPVQGGESPARTPHSGNTAARFRFRLLRSQFAGGACPCSSSSVRPADSSARPAIPPHSRGPIRRQWLVKSPARPSGPPAQHLHLRSGASVSAKLASAGKGRLASTLAIAALAAASRRFLVQHHAPAWRASFHSKAAVYPTLIIRRGKAPPHETEFGINVWCAEVEGGLTSAPPQVRVSEYRLRRGNPQDAPLVAPSVQAHRRKFGRAPREVCGDRGLHSAENERQLRGLGVRRVCLPQPGYKSARRKRREQQPWFRAGLRFRNGIEGRISHLRWARRLDRCLNHTHLTVVQVWLGRPGTLGRVGCHCQ